MKQITKHVLVIAGATLSMSTIQSCTPAVTHRARPDVVADYIKSSWYNPYKSEKDWERSEQRRIALQEIRKGREQLRVLQVALENEAINQRKYHLEQLTINCMKNLEQQSINRDRQLLVKLSQQAKRPIAEVKQYVDITAVKRAKGIITINIEEIV